MPKVKRHFFIWGALALLVIVLFFLPSAKKIGVEEPAKTSVPAAEKVGLKKDQGNPPYSLDIEYPKISGLADQHTADAVNADIKSEVDSAIADLDRNNAPPPAELKGVKSNLTIRYDVAYLNPALLSLEMNFSSYIAGSAHPDNYVLTSTYDLRNGDKVKLSDLFQPGANYLTVLANYVIPRLEADLKADSGNPDAQNWINTGAAPQTSNYDKFLIGKEGLVIIFDPYQVAPYSEGVRRVTVPYALLEKIMDPASVLGARLTAGD